MLRFKLFCTNVKLVPLFCSKYCANWFNQLQKFKEVTGARFELTLIWLTNTLIQLNQKLMDKE